MPPRTRNQPQDHQPRRDPKMFYWTASDGTEIRVPKLDTLDGGIVRRTRKLEPLDQMFTIVEELLSEDELAALDALPLAENNRLFRDWQKDAGATIPQS